MARPFDFPDAVKEQAFLRQWDLCAHCGEPMPYLEDHAHHVIPNQAGDPGDAADDLLRGLDNCVVLCSTCHYAVHDSGRYRDGPVAPPDYYPYSHGKERAQHFLWVQKLEAFLRQKYGPTGPSAKK